jgi:hypothetical protein
MAKLGASGYGVLQCCRAVALCYLVGSISSPLRKINDGAYILEKRDAYWRVICNFSQTLMCAKRHAIVIWGFQE